MSEKCPSSDQDCKKKHYFVLVALENIKKDIAAFERQMLLKEWHEMKTFLKMRKNKTDS